MNNDFVIREIFMIVISLYQDYTSDNSKKYIFFNIVKKTPSVVLSLTLYKPWSVLWLISLSMLPYILGNPLLLRFRLYYFIFKFFEVSHFRKPCEKSVRLKWCTCCASQELSFFSFIDNKILRNYAVIM